MDARQADSASEARDLYQGGLKIVSCYRYGKQDTADWLAGQEAGGRHAKRGGELHVAAGGSFGCADLHLDRRRPTYGQYKAQVAPYLRGWESVIGHQRTGVYANSKTIEWAVQDGLGAYFWQHNWGSPRGWPIRRRICTKWRSTSARWAVSVWTSTTSSSRLSVGGTDTRR